MQPFSETRAEDAAECAARDAVGMLLLLSSMDDAEAELREMFFNAILAYCCGFDFDSWLEPSVN